MSFVDQVIAEMRKKEAGKSSPIVEEKTPRRDGEG
jgi:hypothetical protein